MPTLLFASLITCESVVLPLAGEAVCDSPYDITDGKATITDVLDSAEEISPGGWQDQAIG